jgi:hypothetical protein
LLELSAFKNNQFGSKIYHKKEANNYIIINEIYETVCEVESSILPEIFLAQINHKSF